ncbi:MAG: hypothetical protein GDA49_07120 [Rhodospirillales bacterium]|nr:hypothetical protein [Rhodospirillales bacterium]
MADFKGLIVRSIKAAAPYQIVVIRYLFLAFALFAFTALRNRSDCRIVATPWACPASAASRSSWR